MNTSDVCYSPVPAVQEFLVPEGINPSRIQVLSNALLVSQMNLSRIIMYGECGAANVDDQYISFIRKAMSLNADIYNVFQGIEASRMKYLEAMKGLEQ